MFNCIKNCLLVLFDKKQTNDQPCKFVFENTLPKIHHGSYWQFMRLNEHLIFNGLSDQWSLKNWQLKFEKFH